MKIIYWTQTGNTEAMANAIAEGVKAAGREATVLPVADAKAEEVLQDSVFALGCPAMGAEELEDSEFEPFIASIEGKVAGKTLGLFGSFGWGDGEWMRSFVERMEKAGAKVIGGEGVICQEAPDADATEACKKLGQELAAI